MNAWQRTFRAAGVLLRGAVLSVVQNLGLAALALLLAIALWLFVTDRENPTEARNFNSAIPIELVNTPGDLAVSNVSETSVRIRLEGSQSALEGLVAEDFRATADLGGLTAGTRSVAVDVEPPNDRISVVNITPARVDVTLEPVRSKEVPVRVSTFGSPQAGFAAGETSVDPQEVTVSGPESLVALVESAVAVVNLTGVRTDIVDERVTLQARDERDGGISRVTLSPASADVTIEIEQREFTLQVAVVANLSGQPARGYNVVSIGVEPRFVNVRAPLEVLQAIDALSTEEISIADARDDVTRTVAIGVPEGATLEGPATATVTVSIEPVQGEFAFRVSPRVANARAGSTVIPAEDVVVILAGDVPTLSAIDPGDIDVVIDVGGLGAGLHVVPVEVTPPQGTSVSRVQPGQLGVAITLPQ